MWLVQAMRRPAIVPELNRHVVQMPANEWTEVNRIAAPARNFDAARRHPDRTLDGLHIADAVFKNHSAGGGWHPPRPKAARRVDVHRGNLVGAH